MCVYFRKIKHTPSIVARKTFNQQSSRESKRCHFCRVHFTFSPTHTPLSSLSLSYFAATRPRQPALQVSNRRRRPVIHSHNQSNRPRTTAKPAREFLFALFSCVVNSSAYFCSRYCRLCRNVPQHRRAARKRSYIKPLNFCHVFECECVCVSVRA